MRNLILPAGLIMMAVGLLKTWAHGRALGTITMQGCLGRDYVIMLDPMSVQHLHCWGCYVALLGLILAVSASASFLLASSRARPTGERYDTSLTGMNSLY